MHKYRIRTEIDIRNLPGYTFDAVPEEDPIEVVEDDYHITVATQCGLRSCHQPHNEGVIVRMRSGACTNVGHICGTRFRNYGEKYDEYKREKLTPRYQEQVVSFKRRGDGASATLDQLLSRLTTLSKGANTFRSALPALARVIEHRANRGETKIDMAFERSAQEVENLMASSPGLTRERAKYGTKTIGYLTGLRAFELRGVLAPSRDELQGVLALDVVHSGFDRLSRAARYAAEFDDTIATAQANLADAETFFSARNWTLLQHLATNSGEKETLKSRSPSELLRIEAKNTAQTHKGETKNRPETRFDKVSRAAIKSIFGGGS